MPSECSKQKLVKYHQWPLRFTTQFFYKQAVFVGKNCWVVVCISVAVSMSLSIAWLIPKEQSPQDAIKETARMYAVRNGKYNQNYRSTKHLFDVDANFTTEIWPHQMPEISALRVVVIPKPGHSRIYFNSLFWKDMRRLCGKIRISYNPPNILLPLNMISQFFDRYVCSKRNGKCFLPWVCLGTQNNYANGQPKEKLKPKYGPNTKLFGVRFENVTNSSSEVSNVDHIQSASSLVLYFYHGLDEISLLWEMEAFKNLESFKTSLLCCDLIFHSSVAYFQEIHNSTKSQTGTFTVTVITMFIFLLIVSWKNSFVHSRSTFAFAIMLNTFMAVGSGLSLGELFGVPFVTSVVIAPFIILGVGIDSGLIMIRAWACEISSDDPVERTARSVEKSFASIFLSDLTSILAFLIGSSTPYSAVNFTCRYLVLSLSCLFTAEATFLTACIVIHNKRVMNENHCICCWEKVEDGEEEFIFPFYPKVASKLSFDNGMEKKIGKIFKLIVGSLKIRLLIVAGTLVVVTVSIYHLLHMPVFLDTAEFIDRDSPLQDYLNRDDVISQVNIPVTFVINQTLPYWEVETWYQIRNVQQSLYSTGYFAHDVDIPEYNWLQLLRSYYPKSSNKTEFFKDQLPNLFSKHPVLRRDVVFNTGMGQQQEIMASRFVLAMPVISGLQRTDLAGIFLNTAQKILDEAEFEIFMSHLDFNEWEEMINIASSTWRSIITAIAACSITVLFLIPEGSVFLCVSVTTALTIVSSLGIMAALGLTYNIVTYTQIIVGIGLSIDYMSHAGYSFYIEEGTPLQRCEKSLSSMGVALTNAALSSLIGVLFLSTSSIYGYKTFFISFTTLFTLSFLFGVLFLPVLLSFVASPKIKGKEDHTVGHSFATASSAPQQTVSINNHQTADYSESEDSDASETHQLIGHKEE